MQKHRNLTLDRFQKFTQNGQFDDVNLRALQWKHKSGDTVRLHFYGVPDRKRISFEDAIKGNYVKTSQGQKLGPSWATFWFKVQCTIPKDWAGEKVLLVFDSECEAMVWSTSGEPLTGLTGGGGGERHVDIVLSKSAVGGEHFEYYIEVACNEIFGISGIAPPTDDRYYTLRTAELWVPNQEAQKLLFDFELINDICREMPSESQISSDALYTNNAIVNKVRIDKPETVRDGQKLANEFFAKRARREDADHLIVATGHCHIDTAWLWPYDETKRKSARSWATQCTWMDIYPDFVFSCSQTQQMEWTEQNYPLLFKRIKTKVDKGQFIPIGGTWVEMDTNLPSGEALCRQFLYGQRFLESRFGKRSTVFWLPDTFGYSAQLPQIVKKSGMKYFFSQKLSWNNINRFPHNTFNWIGIDGSSVLAHFSPADTYNGQCNTRDVNFTVKNNKDKEFSNKSLLLFGNGDGGGGPLIPMIEKITRMKKLNGLPADVQMGDPHKFYEDLEKTSNGLQNWKGELYFELHRGTYTSHGLIKLYNRKCEYLLQKLEKIATLCVLRGLDFTYPKKELDRMWKLVLLNQFHDVLPGSSIEMVYDDAMRFYKDVDETATRLHTQALEILTKSLVATPLLSNKPSTPGLLMVNHTSWPLPPSVIEVEADDKHASKYKQMSADGKKAIVLVESIPAMSMKQITFENRPLDFVPVTVRIVDAVVEEDFVKVDQIDASEVVIDNKFVTATFDSFGRLKQYYDKRVDRQVIPEGSLGNVFKYYEDIPVYWDAWDVEVYHLEKGWEADLGTMTVEEEGEARVVLLCQHKISSTSTLVQRIIITSESPMIEFDTRVNWNENRKMLKVEFTVDVSNDVATYECQYGYVQRPTHYNTSWDMAKFEVCGHKFVDYSEFGYGVAIINDCKYGHSVHGNLMRTSLLRSPKMPDLHCDIHEHSFRYAFYPHPGTFHESDVVQTAYQFNVKPDTIPILLNSKTIYDAETLFISSDKDHVVVDTVKLPEPSINSKGVESANLDTKACIVRLYEAHGGRGSVKLFTSLKVQKAFYCNILEDEGDSVDIETHSGALVVKINPFEIVNLKLYIQ